MPDPVDERRINGLVGQHLFNECCHDWQPCPPECSDDGLWEWRCAKCKNRFTHIPANGLPVVGDGSNYLTGYGMLLVIAKMRELGWFFYTDNCQDDDSWAATFCEYREFCGGKTGSAIDRKAPLAVALSALRALGVEV